MQKPKQPEIDGVTVVARLRRVEMALEMCVSRLEMIAKGEPIDDANLLSMIADARKALKGQRFF